MSMSRFAGQYDVTFSWTDEWRARLDVLHGPDVINTGHSRRVSHAAVSWCSGWTSHEDNQTSSTGASNCSHLQVKASSSSSASCFIAGNYKEITSMRDRGQAEISTVVAD